jgi:hypothetical protein
VLVAGVGDQLQASTIICQAGLIADLPVGQVEVLAAAAALQVSHQSK